MGERTKELLSHAWLTLNYIYDININFSLNLNVCIAKFKFKVRDSDSFVLSFNVIFFSSFLYFSG